MKKATKIITCLLLSMAILSVSVGYAQQDPAARAAAMKQKLIDELKLTGVQADSVVAIGQEFRPKMREVFMDQAMSQDDKKAKLDEINSQRGKRVQAVLGDDLYKKYQDWEEKNRAQRGGGKGNQ